MADPAVAAVAESFTSGDTTSHSVTLPSGIAAGHLLLGLGSYDGELSVATWPAGWAQLYQAQCGSPTQTAVGGAWWRWATGGESSPITVTTNNSEQSVHAVLRVTDAANQTPGSATFANTGTNPNPPNLAPSGGSKTYLWVACYHADAGQDASGFPAGYGGTSYIESSGAAPASLGYGYKVATATSDDPGNFTIPSGEQYLAATIAVYPGVATEQFPFRRRNIMLVWS